MTTVYEDMRIIGTTNVPAEETIDITNPVINPFIAKTYILASSVNYTVQMGNAVGSNYLTKIIEITGSYTISLQLFYAQYTLTSANTPATFKFDPSSQLWMCSTVQMYPATLKYNSIPAPVAPANAINFGWSISMNHAGDRAIIGSFDLNVGTGQQGAFIYDRTLNKWSRTIFINGSGAVGANQQGNAVAISGDGLTAAIGGPIDNNNIGAVWIFIYSGGVWQQQGAKIVPADRVGGARIGTSVALSYDGTTLAFGGRNDNSEVGAVWIYTRSSSNVWTQQAKLIGSGAIGAARQGVSCSLSISGDTCAFGGTEDNGQVGSTWVFMRSAGVWAENTQLIGTGASGASLQGTSVSLSFDGATLAVGGRGDGGGGDPNGAVWIFVYDSNTDTWSQQGNKINAGSATRQNGYSVQLNYNGNCLVFALTGRTGVTNIIAAVYTRNGVTWTFQKFLYTDIAGPVEYNNQGPNTIGMDRYGYTAMVEGSTFAPGVFSIDNVYIYC